MKTTSTHSHHSRYRLPSTQRERGLTLVELMVGLSIGLLVVAVAMGALVASRGISGTVSDASSIQQQASYILRTIGMQVRQSGSLYLNTEDENSVVLKEPEEAPLTPGNANNSFTVSYSADPSANSSADCLGRPDYSAGDPISSLFVFTPSENSLRCAGIHKSPDRQPIASNVADFQVRYLLQTHSGSKPQVRYVESLSTSDTNVMGVEICLTLFGHEQVPFDDDSTYLGCGTDGTPEKVKMKDITGDRRGRMHLTFRNVFQLRGKNQYSFN